MMKVFRESHLALPDRRQGKVRESYALPGGYRLLVTTDRLSAFDRVLGCVPYKGQVLNELAAWWFGQLDDTHLSAVPDPNATVAFEATPLSVEIVMRGYITGVTQTSLWYRYSLGEREIYGYRLPDGLVKNQQLERPLLTPTTKGGATGHDERLTMSEAAALVGSEVWDTAAQMAREIFAYGQEVALERGLLLVDSKYEFGVTAEGRVLLIDEVHTPDSSRFWTAATYDERLAAGEEPDSFDKEFVRLAFAEQGYRGDGEPPEMPDELWRSASRLYIDVFEQLTGHGFVPGMYPVEERLEANLHREGWL